VWMVVPSALMTVAQRADSSGSSSVVPLVAKMAACLVQRWVVRMVAMKVGPWAVATAGRLDVLTDESKVEYSVGHWVEQLGPMTVE